MSLSNPQSAQGGSVEIARMSLRCWNHRRKQPEEFENPVDRGSQRLFDRNLQTGSESGTGAVDGIGVLGGQLMTTGASPGFAAPPVFLQYIQLRDVVFQRRDRSGGAFRQGFDKFLEIHVCRALMDGSVGVGLSGLRAGEKIRLRESLLRQTQRYPITR